MQSVEKDRDLFWVQLKRICKECDDNVEEIENLCRLPAMSLSKSAQTELALKAVDDVESELVSIKEAAGDTYRNLVGDTNFSRIAQIADNLLKKSEKAIGKAVVDLQRKGCKLPENLQSLSFETSDLSIGNDSSNLQNERPEENSFERSDQLSGIRRNTLAATPKHTPLNTTFTSNSKPFPRQGIPIITKLSEDASSPIFPSAERKQCRSAMKRWGSSPEISQLKPDYLTNMILSNQKQISTFGSHSSGLSSCLLSQIASTELPKLNFTDEEIFRMQNNLPLSSKKPAPDLTRTINFFEKSPCQAIERKMEPLLPIENLPVSGRSSPDVTKTINLLGTLHLGTNTNSAVGGFMTNHTETPKLPELSDVTKKLLEEFNINSKKRVMSVRKLPKYRQHRQ